MILEEQQNAPVAEMSHIESHEEWDENTRYLVNQTVAKRFHDARQERVNAFNNSLKPGIARAIRQTVTNAEAEFLTDERKYEEILASYIDQEEALKAIKRSTDSLALVALDGIDSRLKDFVEEFGDGSSLVPIDGSTPKFKHSPTFPDLVFKETAALLQSTGVVKPQPPSPITGRQEARQPDFTTDCSSMNRLSTGLPAADRPYSDASHPDRPSADRAAGSSTAEYPLPNRSDFSSISKPGQSRHSSPPRKRTRSPDVHDSRKWPRSRESHRGREDDDDRNEMFVPQRGNTQREENRGGSMNRDYHCPKDGAAGGARSGQNPERVFHKMKRGGKH